MAEGGWRVGCGGVNRALIRTGACLCDVRKVVRALTVLHAALFLTLPVLTRSLGVTGREKVSGRRILPNNNRDV